MTMDGHMPAPDNRRGSFLLLFSTLIIVGFGNTMLLAILPPLARRMDLPDTSVGWIFSLSALIWVFASSFWGRTSDRTGRKPIIALGLGAYAVSMTFFGLICIVGVNHLVSPALIFIGLLLARAIFGAVGSASSPAGQAYVADRTSAAERTEELASLGSAFALGAALGPALAGVIAARVGPITPIFIVAALSAFASFAIMRFLPESKTPELPLEGKRETSWKMALDRRVSGHLIYGFGLSLVGGTLQQTFTFYTMDRLNLDEQTTIVYASNGLMVGALALLATQLGLLRILKLGARPLMVLGAIIMALAVLVQIWADSLNLLLVSQMLLGVGGGLARPGFSGGASLSVRQEEQGGLAGLVVAINGAGFVFSPLTGVTLYEMAGVHAPLWLATGVLVAMALFALLSRRLRSTGGVSSSSQHGGPEGG